MTKGQCRSVNGHAGVQNHLKDVQSAGKVANVCIESHLEVFITAGQTKGHEDGKIKFGC